MHLMLQKGGIRNDSAQIFEQFHFSDSPGSNSDLLMYSTSTSTGTWMTTKDILILRRQIRPELSEAAG